MTLHIIILAAGNGKRMRSSLPKVLHRVGGKFLLEHVITTAKQLNPEVITVVYGHQGEHVRTALSDLDVQWVEQKEQLGTGHAVSEALPHVAPNAKVLILFGDVPLISVATLQTLLTQTPQDALGLLTVVVDHPHGFGRIMRDAADNICGIIEEKDATPVQRKIREIYPGTLLLSALHLRQWLPKLSANNASGEYYLTELIALAAEQRCTITDVRVTQTEEVQGVNNRAELAKLERYYQKQRAQELMHQGLTLMDPDRFDLRGNLTVGIDTIIDINVLIEGNVTIGNNCYIGPHVVLKNAQIGDGTEIKANSVVEDAIIGTDCRVGPFARIRPGTHMGACVHIGNFVEVKNVKIGHSSKVNHLSYLGDAILGAEVNVGAGTITCNYDGVNKHQTIIGDRAFIGSDTQLIAPVTVGAEATIGAGSTITKDAPANMLTLSRSVQKSIKGWQRSSKEKKAKN